MNQTAVQDAVDIEAYPKAGAPNPIADVLVYDVGARKTTHIDVRDGKPFDNTVVGHYVYGMQWAPDGSGELLMERANRRQQIVEFVACSPATGKCRVVASRRMADGLAERRYRRANQSVSRATLAEGRQALHLGIRTQRLEELLPLRSARGKLLNSDHVEHDFRGGAIVKIDEANNVMFYTARDGDNYMKLQLHRVGLDGTGDVRLTDPKFNAHGAAAARFRSGQQVFRRRLSDARSARRPRSWSTPRRARCSAQMAKSDMTKYEQAGFKKAEQFTYMAADGKTTLYGQISFPSNFDPAKKYPTLVSVYGGPDLQSNIPTENFAGPNANAEYGFLMVLVSYRGVPGTGKRAADALYMQLGVAEMDDMAHGIKALWTRPYFDKTRVGMYGTSYGGYTSATMILRYPDVVTAASASSPVTRLAPLRFDLHRALHVDSAGEHAKATTPAAT